MLQFYNIKSFWQRAQESESSMLILTKIVYRVCNIRYAFQIVKNTWLNFIFHYNEQLFKWISWKRLFNTLPIVNFTCSVSNYWAINITMKTVINLGFSFIPLKWNTNKKTIWKCNCIVIDLDIIFNYWMNKKNSGKMVLLTHFRYRNDINL